MRGVHLEIGPPAQYTLTVTSPVSVRPAVPGDAATLARLRYDLRAEMVHTAEQTSAFLARCERWMRERLEDDALWRCWVAEQGGEVAGTIWLQIIEKIPNPLGEYEQHGYITNFFVRKGARGAGVGSALLATLLGAGETQRVDALILWPTERSRALYARHGFAVRADVIERRPAAGPAQVDEPPRIP
jgi:GNAT superfamily N-acetyltransferase